MLMSLFALYLLATPTVDAFKREMGPLQTGVDTMVASTGAQITRTAQALLLSVVPRGPSGLRSRRRFVAPSVVRRSSRAGPVRGRVSPYPSPVPLPE